MREQWKSNCKQVSTKANTFLVAESRLRMTGTTEKEKAEANKTRALLQDFIKKADHEIIQNQHVRTEKEIQETENEA